MSRRLALPVLAAAFAALALPLAALAHPLGNFTINHYARLEPSGDRLRVTYVLDMAEIPAFQEQAALDRDGDGTVTDAERATYADRKAEELRQGLRLTLDGRDAPLELKSRALSFPPGQGGLSLLRLEAVYEAHVAAGAALNAQFQDQNYPGRIGWKEIVVRGGAGAQVLDSDAPATDQSDELRSYPTDMLTSPLDRTAARFRFRAGLAGQAGGLLAALPSAVSRPVDAYANLVSAESLSMTVVLFSLLAAAFWGALHALTPGHGKSVVAAYLVGSRGTAQHAAFLGATVTITHTLGVYALGLLTLYASQYIVPEQLYPWLSLLSGLVVVVMGVTLLGRRLRGVLRWQPAAAPAQRLALAGVGALPLQMLTREHDHGQSHGDDHNHAGAHGLAYAHHADADHDHGHAHGVAHTHHGDQDEDHDHGPHGHSHLPPGADGTPISWRSLLALGISGGMLPCPSALVVMLGAIALNRVAFGLVLVLAFSVGLAGVLIGLGLLLVYAGRMFSRVPASSRVFRLVPAGSALVILLLGLALSAQSLAQTGLV